MKWFNVVMMVWCFFVFGCKNNSTGPNISGPLSDYFPIKAGNVWTYSGSTTTTEGHTSNAVPGTLSILAVNTLIGGNPNAFVVQAHDTNNQQNLAFCTNGKTLFLYRGAADIFTLPGYLYWNSGGISGAVVAPGQAKTYTVNKNSLSNALPISILHQPNTSIANALLTDGYSLQITGVAKGTTSLVLQRTDESVADTMTVLIEIKTGGNAVTPPFSSWIPIWQLGSSDGETMYSFDTTYTFKCTKDSSVCIDDISYQATCQFLGTESVTALGSIIPAEKFLSIYSINENISVGGSAVFHGLSANASVTLWLVKGVGFVKASYSGSGLNAGTIVGGTYDASGILHGFFLSPRITYIDYNMISPFHGDTLVVNTTALAAPTITSTAVLTAKNF
ncbi:MAG TPA: hypothetical protein VMU30_10865 [Bacteroidota bacterium]|nr:hypothetical protein [Bacteroidota bacterium]